MAYYTKIDVKSVAMGDLIEKLEGVTLVETEEHGPILEGHDYQLSTFEYKVFIALKVGNGDVTEFTAGPFRIMDEALEVFGPHHHPVGYAIYKSENRPTIRKYVIYRNAPQIGEVED